MRKILVTVGLILCLAGTLAGGGGKKEKEEKPYALLFGSVHTAEGLSLPGIPVSIKRKDDSKPKWHAVSDHRGEFAVRLPAGPGTYEVETHSKEHENQSKSVEVHGEERVDVLFRLAEKKTEGEKQ